MQQVFFCHQQKFIHGTKLGDPQPGDNGFPSSRNESERIKEGKWNEEEGGMSSDVIFLVSKLVGVVAWSTS